MTDALSSSETFIPVMTTCLPFDLKEDSYQRHSWLGGRITLLSSEDYLALIPEADVHATGVDQAISVAPGCGGVGFIPLGEKSDRLKQLFAAGRLLWCRRTAAEFWEIRRKPVLGLRPGPRLAIHALWIGQFGPVRYLVPVTPVLIPFVQPVPRSGCNTVIVAEVESRREAGAAWKRMFESYYAGFI